MGVAKKFCACALLHYLCPLTFQMLPTPMCVCVDVSTPSNHTFYRQIISYWMSVDDRPQVMGKQISYLTLIIIIDINYNWDSTMHLVYPN